MRLGPNRGFPIPTLRPNICMYIYIYAHLHGPFGYVKLSFETRWADKRVMYAGSLTSAWGSGGLSKWVNNGDN